MKKQIIVLSLFAIAMILVSAQTIDQNIRENTSINATEDKVDSSGTIFRPRDDGTVQINPESTRKTIASFAVTGKVSGRDIIYNSQDFKWTWSRDFQDRLMEEVNLTTDEHYNVSYKIWNYSAVNNDRLFTWKRELVFNPYQTDKIKDTITNNLGRDIKNITYWYIFEMSERTKTRFDKVDRRTGKEDSVHLVKDFDRLPKYIDLGAIEFRYGDLYDNNFTISEIYFGNGSFLGLKDKSIVAVGVIKGNRILRNKETVILDPQATGFKSPEEAASPSGEWTNPTNVKTSNNAYARTSTFNDILNTTVYGFGIPDEAVITGIIVRVEAAAGPCTG